MVDVGRTRKDSLDDHVSSDATANESVLKLETKNGPMCGNMEEHVNCWIKLIQTWKQQQVKPD